MIWLLMRMVVGQRPNRTFCLPTTNQAGQFLAARLSPLHQLSWNSVKIARIDFFKQSRLLQRPNASIICKIHQNIELVLVKFNRNASCYAAFKFGQIAGQNLLSLILRNGHTIINSRITSGRSVAITNSPNASGAFICLELATLKLLQQIAPAFIGHFHYT